MTFDVGASTATTTWVLVWRESGGTIGTTAPVWQGGRRAMDLRRALLAFTGLGLSRRAVVSILWRRFFPPPTRAPRRAVPAPDPGPPHGVRYSVRRPQRGAHTRAGARRPVRTRRRAPHAQPRRTPPQRAPHRTRGPFRWCGPPRSERAWV